MHKEMESPRSVWTSDHGSMAHETAKSRWPKIVQGMIDDVRVTGAELAPSHALDEINSIERSLRRLREEITGNDQLWLVLLMNFSRRYITKQSSVPSKMMARQTLRRTIRFSLIWAS